MTAKEWERETGYAKWLHGCQFPQGMKVVVYVLAIFLSYVAAYLMNQIDETPVVDLRAPVTELFVMTWFLLASSVFLGEIANSAKARRWWAGGLIPFITFWVFEALL